MEYKDRWAIVLWEYGRYCDQFVIQKVIGPLSYEEAEKFEEEYEGNYHVEIASMKGE